MTVRYHWQAQSLAPLHFAGGRALGEAAETLHYIPGTALRGALAAAFLAANDASAPGLRPLTEDARFSNLYPVAGTGAASAPLPLSSVTCGHTPGFLADGGHGVGDLLLAAEAALLAKEATAGANGPPAAQGWIPPDREALAACRRCPEERRRLPAPGTIPWRGFYARREEGPLQASVNVGTALEGKPTGRRQLTQHTVTVRQTLVVGQHFSGIVAFPDTGTADMVTQLLRRQDDQLWVGAGRSRGLGAVHIAITDVAALDEDMASRQAGLTAALVKRGAPNEVALPENYSYMALTLQSAALLPDAFGRWQRTISADALSAWAGWPAGTVELRQAFVAETAIEGWNAALGLPKPDAMAIAAGSCWLFRIRDVPVADVVAAFQRLEAEGIGDRRQEGFGMLRACDALHWQEPEMEQEQPA